MFIIPACRFDLDTLPDDPALLQQMLREVVTAAHTSRRAARRERQAALLIQRLLRHQFGRRSEQLTADQLQFGLEDLEQTIAENQAGQDAAEPIGDARPNGAAAQTRRTAIMVRYRRTCRAMRW